MNRIKQNTPSHKPFASPSTSRNTPQGMFLSSYSLYCQNITPSSNTTPFKKTLLTKSFFLNKTTKSKAKHKPTKTFFNSKLSHRPEMHRNVKEEKNFISIVKKGLYLPSTSRHIQKHKVELVNFQTEAKKVKYVQSKMCLQEHLKLKLLSLNKKVKMLQTINDYIYPHLLKIKKDSIKNDIIRIKAINQINTKKKLRLNLDSNHISVRELYKTKEYHDRLYQYTIN